MLKMRIKGIEMSFAKKEGGIYSTVSDMRSILVCTELIKKKMR